MRQLLQKTTSISNSQPFNKRWPFAILMLLLLSINGCKDDDEVLSDKDKVANTFEEVIRTAGIPEKVEKKEEIIDSTESEEIREDGSIWICSTKTYSVEDGNSDFPLFNPNASVVYPGSLLQGKTLSNASPSVIPLPRAGGTISIDIIDGSSTPAFTVDEVSKSSIATAANTIVGSSTGVVPANFNATFEEISSEEHLAFSLGLDVKSQYVEVAAKFAFSKEEGYSHFLVKLNQSFYTLSFDLPTTYDDLFAPQVTPQDLSQYAGPGNPVTFISDVTYGRIYYMLIEYSSSATEIRSSLEAAFSGTVASAEISAAADYLKSTSGLKIKVVAFGGEAKSTFATIGETNIGKLAELFGESTDIRSGVPISYVVRDAKNKETVGVKLATEYDVKECKAVATALGKPIMWLDAELVYQDMSDPQNIEQGEGLCTGTTCVKNDGDYGYSGNTSDAYASTVFLPGMNGGLAVEKWNDVSESGHFASSIAGDPASRPVLAVDALNNGKDALEFFKHSGSPGKEYHGRMTYSGGIMVNTDYTIFAVLAYPQAITFHYKNGITNDWLPTQSYTNNYGFFMSGNSSSQYEQLVLGFENENRFVMGHGGGYQLAIEDANFKPQATFQVFAFRFSQEHGMAVYVNGKLIAEDKSLTHPLTGNPGAMISSGIHYNSRVRISEIKVYQQAATDVQIAQETQYMNQKYGL